MPGGSFACFGSRPDPVNSKKIFYAVPQLRAGHAQRERRDEMSTWVRHPAHLGAIILFTAFVVATGVKAQITAGAYKGSQITQTDAIAVTVRKALESRKAFESGFLVFVNGRTKKQLEDARKKHEAVMKAFGSKLRTKTEFIFIDGVLVTFSGVGGSSSMIYPMKGEDVKNPSMFNFPPGQKTQAYVVYSCADRTGAEYSLHFLMWKIKGAWRAVNSAVFPRKAHGTDFDKTFDAARREHAANRQILALALCYLAGDLSMGPSYRMSGRQRRLRSLHGQVVQSFNLARNKRFDTLATKYGNIDILRLRGICFEDGTSICIGHYAPRDKNRATTKAREKSIALAFLKKHPRLKDYFTQILVATEYTDPTRTNKKHRSKYSVAELEGKAGPTKTAPTQPATKQAGEGSRSNRPKR